MTRFSRRALPVFVLACLAGCVRDPQTTVPRIAILRFENLSADPSLDWIGRAFALVVSDELRGSLQRYVIQPPTLRAFDAALGAPVPPFTEALVAGANTVVHGQFYVANGTLRATATEEDLLTHKMVLVASAAGPVGAGILPVADALARQIGVTHPFGTRNPEALRSFADGDYAQAVAADPDFGRAYVYWLDTMIAQRNSLEAERIIHLARSRAGRFSPLDRASLDQAVAGAHADFAALLSAQRELARLDPANPGYHRNLGQSLTQMREFDAAVTELRRGLSVQPDDIIALNMMGYAATFNGDLPTAIRVLRAYEALRPNEPNPLDSLGDAHFALGHFREAEQFYLAAYKRWPQFINGVEQLKAAQAGLMTGDVSGATALFQRYYADRQALHDVGAEFQAAEWSWMTGARRDAIARIDRLTPGPRELACRAHIQEAIWLLESGDRAGAANHARMAVGTADPGTAGSVALIAYLTDPEHFPVPTQKPFDDYARAYALLYARQFKPAAEALEKIYAPPGSFDDGLAILLAWAYIENGDLARAEPLLRLNPLPQTGGIPMLSTLYFPRLFALRGAVLDHLGHHELAAQNYKLFRLLSGQSSATSPSSSSESARPAH